MTSVAALTPLPVGFPQKHQGSAMTKEVPFDNMFNLYHTHRSDRNTELLLTLLLHSPLRAFMRAASAAD